MTSNLTTDDTQYSAWLKTNCTIDEEKVPCVAKLMSEATASLKKLDEECGEAGVGTDPVFKAIVDGFGAEYAYDAVAGGIIGTAVSVKPELEGQLPAQGGWGPEGPSASQQVVDEEEEPGYEPPAIGFFPVVDKAWEIEGRKLKTPGERRALAEELLGTIHFTWIGSKSLLPADENFEPQRTEAVGRVMQLFMSEGALTVQQTTNPINFLNGMNRLEHEALAIRA